MMILRKGRGFTLVEIMIVVAIIGLLAAIAIPNFVVARRRARTSACIANLKQIEGAKQIWALEEGQSDTDTVAMTDLTPDYLKKEPHCPENTDAAYSMGANVIADPSCITDATNHTL